MRSSRAAGTPPPWRRAKSQGCTGSCWTATIRALATCGTRRCATARPSAVPSAVDSGSAIGSRPPSAARGTPLRSRGPTPTAPTGSGGSRSGPSQTALPPTRFAPQRPALLVPATRGQCHPCRRPPPQRRRGSGVASAPIGHVRIAKLSRTASACGMRAIQPRRRRRAQRAPKRRAPARRHARSWCARGFLNCPAVSPITGDGRSSTSSSSASTGSTTSS
mmetsp:Transcript_65392/g.200251  ORF Transcript_65392/g.200251 Transcript_65392/m.200251 type:complete len:220 (+) Transcript_65392:838-1497(+)